MPVMNRLSCERRRAGRNSPFCHNQCDRRWRAMACNPGDVSAASIAEREAGSRSRMARISFANNMTRPFCQEVARTIVPARGNVAAMRDAPGAPLRTGAITPASAAAVLRLPETERHASKQHRYSPISRPPWPASFRSWRCRSFPICPSSRTCPTSLRHPRCR